MALSQQKKNELEQRYDALLHGFIRGTVNLPDDAVVVLDPVLYAKLFTQKRLELLNYINTYHPASIQELADSVKRKKQAVDRDLKVLERYELVGLIKTGRVAQPIVKKQLVLFNLQPAQIQRESPIEATA